MIEVHGRNWGRVHSNLDSWRAVSRDECSKLLGLQVGRIQNHFQVCGKKLHLVEWLHSCFGRAISPWWQAKLTGLTINVPAGRFSLVLWARVYSTNGHIPILPSKKQLPFSSNLGLATAHKNITFIIWFLFWTNRFGNSSPKATYSRRCSSDMHLRLKIWPLCQNMTFF